jgi:uncharacterized phiE125 gp8 family phage protein
MNSCDLASARLAAVAESYGVREVAAVAFADEPLTLADAWHHLRIETFDSPPASADDTWLETIGIPAARAWAEGYCGLTIATKTLEYAGNGFPTVITLPFGPVREVTSIAYVDADGATQTLDPAEYTVNVYAGTVKPVTSWPSVKDQDRSVIVTYEAGYSTDSPATPLPPNVRIGLLLLLGHLYENREDTSAVNLSVVPTGARTFLDWHRKRCGFA